MRIVGIREKLSEIDYPVESLSLGDFDLIGEHTAKKRREPNSELYKSVGAFYRPNYERGLLIYSLIRKFNVSSFLEIGFGRGYSTFCAAKAMVDSGIQGQVITIDPEISEEKVKPLTSIFPREWFNLIKFAKGTSKDLLPKVEGNVDMIYVDGDHRYEAVKLDWELCKGRYNKFLLFDDYHLPSNEQKDIEVARVVDQIDDPSKELIIGDRRIFFDDRRVPDDKIDYGQVLLRNPDFNDKEFILEW